MAILGTLKYVSATDFRVMVGLGRLRRLGGINLISCQNSAVVLSYAQKQTIILFLGVGSGSFISNMDSMQHFRAI